MLPVFCLDGDKLTVGIGNDFRTEVDFAGTAAGTLLRPGRHNDRAKVREEGKP